METFNGTYFALNAHFELYMKNLEILLNTPDHADNGYFVEVDLKYPYSIKEQTIFFHLLPKMKYVKIMILVIRWKKSYLRIIYQLKSLFVVGLIKRSF